MKLEVRIGAAVRADFQRIERYYGVKQGRPDVADRIVAEIFDGMDKLATNQYGRRTSDELPTDYRRFRVGKYIIFYLIHRPSRTLFVHEVRHGARKPLLPQTHRQRAAKAQQESYPLPPPGSRS